MEARSGRKTHGKQGGKLAAGTVKNYYKVIRRFCELNKINLVWKKILRYVGKVRKKANDRVPRYDEMIKWISHRDRRVKLVVLMMSSCGMRLGAWEFLRWKHVVPITRDGKVVAAKLVIYAEEPEEYYTFISGEAFEILNWWMETRQREGEKINDDSWLIREDWARKGLGFGAANPENKTITARAIKKMLSTALREQGLRGKPRKTSGAVRYEFSTDHSLRKWFETKAVQGGMNLLSAEMLMGHETGLPANYIRPTEPELLEEYLKVVDSLTINKQVAIEQVSETIVKQQQLALQMESKDQEIHTMKEQMDKMGNVMKKLDSSMRFYRNEFMYYVMKFGHPLTGKDRERLEVLLEKVEAHNDDNGRVGMDIQDENSLKEDYVSADVSTNSVIPIDSVEAKFIKQVSKSVAKQVLKTKTRPRPRKINS